MAPPNQLAKLSTHVKGDSISKVESPITNSAVFGESIPANRVDYLPLFGVIFALQDYLSGKGNYDLVKSKIKAWAQSSNYGNPVNQAARKNLLTILEGITDGPSKSRASSALVALKSGSKEVAVSPSNPPEEKGNAKGLDQKPIAVPVVASPGKNVPKVASTDLKKWTEAKNERESRLSASALGWSEAKSKQYPHAAYAIMTVKDFVAGRELQTDFVRKALIAWRELPEFEKDPALKQTYQNLMKALEPSSLLAEYNKAPAASMLALMKEVDGGVAKLGKVPIKTVASNSPAAPLKGKQGAKESAKQPPPAPAPAPANPSASTVPVSELLSDTAIFGNQASAWNDPSVKNGRCLALNGALYALKDFLDGKGDYPKLKEKLSTWEGSSCYKDPLSYRARTNLLAILSSVKSDSAYYSKAQSALIALKVTKPIDPPKDPEPPAKAPTAAVPVTYSEMDVIPNSKAPSSGDTTVDSFKTIRLEIAKREHSKMMAKSGKTFNFSGEAYVEIDAKGEISKVTYKKVNAIRLGETGDNVTSSEVAELLKNIANAYRAEVKFGKVEKNKLGFTLNLTAGAGAPAAPVPPPVVTPVDNKGSDPVKGSYSFSYSSGPQGLDRSDGPDNALAAVSRSLGLSRAAFERFLKNDSGLSLIAKATIETDPATGYVTKVSFGEIKSSGGMTGAMAEEMLRKFADQLNNQTRWKKIQQGGDTITNFSIPVTWRPKG